MYLTESDINNKKKKKNRKESENNDIGHIRRLTYRATPPSIRGFLQVCASGGEELFKNDF